MHIFKLNNSIILPVIKVNNSQISNILDVILKIFKMSFVAYLISSMAHYPVSKQCPEE